jgi:hypothetical protein
VRVPAADVAAADTRASGPSAVSASPGGAGGEVRIWEEERGEGAGAVRSVRFSCLAARAPILRTTRRPGHTNKRYRYCRPSYKDARDHQTLSRQKRNFSRRRHLIGAYAIYVAGVQYLVVAT